MCDTEEASIEFTGEGSWWSGGGMPEEMSLLR